jgi:hypothetical protein
MNLANIGVSIMHQSECLAKGGFKIINGPPRVGKGPMESEEYQEMNKRRSLPAPTHPGREDRNMHGINKTSNEVLGKQRQTMRNEVNWGVGKGELPQR